MGCPLKCHLTGGVPPQGLMWLGAGLGTGLGAGLGAALGAAGWCRAGRGGALQWQSGQIQWFLSSREIGCVHPLS